MGYRYRETLYSIRAVVGGYRTTDAQVRLKVDGREQDGDTLLLVDDRVDHVVEVTWTAGAAKAPATPSLISG